MPENALFHILDLITQFRNDPNREPIDIADGLLGIQQFVDPMLDELYNQHRGFEDARQEEVTE